jgi:hypothetical protein
MKFPHELSKQTYTILRLARGVGDLDFLLAYSALVLSGAMSFSLCFFEVQQLVTEITGMELTKLQDSK